MGLTLSTLNNTVDFAKFHSAHTTPAGDTVQVYAYDLRKRGIAEQFTQTVELIKALQHKPYYPYATTCFTSPRLGYFAYRPLQQAEPLYYVVGTGDVPPWCGYFDQMLRIMEDIDQRGGVFAASAWTFW